MARQELKVTGMTCQHCVSSVKQALEAVPGVSSAEVFLERGSATVETAGEVSLDSLKAAIEEEGYTCEQIAP